MLSSKTSQKLSPMPYGGTGAPQPDVHAPHHIGAATPGLGGAGGFPVAWMRQLWGPQSIAVQSEEKVPVHVWSA